MVGVVGYSRMHIHPHIQHTCIDVSYHSHFNGIFSIYYFNYLLCLVRHARKAYKYMLHYKRVVSDL